MDRERERERGTERDRDRGRDTETEREREGDVHTPRDVRILTSKSRASFLLLRSSLEATLMLRRFCVHRMVGLAFEQPKIPLSRKHSPSPTRREHYGGLSF